jgi:hypothetical protein
MGGGGGKLGLKEVRRQQDKVKQNAVKYESQTKMKDHSGRNGGKGQG